MAEKKKVKCYTRTRNNGSKYVTCQGGKKFASKKKATTKKKQPMKKGTTAKALLRRFARVALANTKDTGNNKESSKAVFNRIQRKIGVPPPAKNDMKNFLAQQRALYGVD